VERPKRKRAGNASIRDNFDDFSDESEDVSRSAMSLPGPGSYIKDHSTFGRSTISKPESFQFFGSGVERFKNPHAGSSVNAFKQVVGPGLYDSLQKPQTFRQQVF